MRRLLLSVFVLLTAIGARAQSALPLPGDPPRLADISISAAGNGLVTMDGSSGAVFSGAYLALRNLYTGATVYTHAGITGSFRALIAGSISTPFWISPSAQPFSPKAQVTFGSLPGGPGVIFYRPSTEAETQPQDTGVVHTKTIQNGTPFSLAGTLPNGAAWSARGQVDTLALTPGATWHIETEVDSGAFDLPADATLIGQIALQPIARRVDGQVRIVGGLGSNNGWSSVLTPGGLPIDNLTNSSVTLGEAAAHPAQIIRGRDGARFPLDTDLTLPADLPPGLYVPLLSVYLQSADGTRTIWTQQDTRLPLVVNVGAVSDVRLLWTLFADDPSDGSRGILPAEDQKGAALSNRVRFNSPTYILPPFQPGTRSPIPYSLEPYLLDLLANSYAANSVPLIPFKFPGGQLQAHITRPDGTVDDLGTAAIVQNQLSTPAQDERTLFGAQSPLDEYRLATLNPRFSAYPLAQYGQYIITLSGSLQDVWGNRYQGGGTYQVLAAEPLDLTPGVLPGTPFQVGDALNFGAHLSPGVPAGVTATVRVYPLDGSTPIQRMVSGKANANGDFQPNEPPFTFTTPGEYVIDYDARYSAPDQRLWAASLRGAGVIAGAQPTIVAHGARGVPDIADPRPAWFSLPQLEQAAGVEADHNTLSFPYHSGDVAWVDDGRASLVQPIIRLQDLNSRADTASSGDLTERQANAGELPVTMTGASDSYTYISAVRPNITVRQFVAGGDAGGLPLGWDEDDPLNRQIGAGIDGSAPGDFIFLFGGAILRAGERRDAAIYGALAVVTADEPPRIYPPDRGAAGGADGGPLLTINDLPVDTFIDLTGVQPGEALKLGDTIAVAGQVAPPLAATVTTIFTAPSGRIVQFSGKANPVGYYYDPAHRFTADEPGIWSVDVEVVQDGITSAGQIEPPFPQGGVIGSSAGRFSIYVLPPDSQPLPWNSLLTDTIIPIVSPYNFSFTLPESWSNVQAFYTLTTPGTIIEQGALHVSGRSFSYPYTAPLQSRVFPNLENVGTSGAYIADVRTLTFVATGVDASGAPQIRSRTFTLMHDRLITTG